MDTLQLIRKTVQDYIYRDETEDLVLGLAELDVEKERLRELFYEHENGIDTAWKCFFDNMKNGHGKIKEEFKDLSDSLRGRRRLEMLQSMLFEAIYTKIREEF